LNHFYLKYRTAVLAYYRGEWTDIHDNDLDYKLRITVELDQLIRECFLSSTNIPNAAKEVSIFLQTFSERW